jgi:Fe/S biogenesis protein NfuA
MTFDVRRATWAAREVRLRIRMMVGGGEAMSDPMFEVETTERDRSVGPAVVDVTDAARDVVLGARAAENDPEHLALWIEVTGTTGNAYSYDIYFQALTDASEEDSVYRCEELTVVVPSTSADRLQGARLDWSEDGDGGLVIVNPNTPPRSAPAAEVGDLSGDLAQRVLSVLEEQVNPAIAMHGGRADLIRMDGAVAILNLSGGCQGCGMARATLSQGIEVALKEAIPELEGVVDTTDHDRGTNPYYAAAH